MARIHCDFRSEALQLSCSMYAIVPEAPAAGRAAVADGRTRYPTLFLLHGLSDDHSVWARRTSIERYAEAAGMAVVMPAVHRSFYTDMEGPGYRYFAFVSEEVPAVARSLFPLSAAREDNFVAGLSMGGYGAFKLALSRPGEYAAAASLSGALDIARLAGDEARRKEFTATFGDLSRLAGGPNDLMALAERAARAGNCPRLYQHCGTEDFLHADNLRFRDRARRLGLPLTSEEGPGAHEWGLWDRQIQRVLQWLGFPRGPGESPAGTQIPNLKLCVRRRERKT